MKIGMKSKNILIVLLMIFALIVMIAAILYYAIYSLIDIKGNISYTRIDRIKDDRAGVSLELGEINSLSSFGYVLNVIEDANEIVSIDWVPILEIYSVTGKPILAYDGECYTVTAEYGRGGIRDSMWRDSSKGSALCFRLLPDSGPKGGWKP